MILSYRFQFIILALIGFAVVVLNVLYFHSFYSRLRCDTTSATVLQEKWQTAFEARSYRKVEDDVLKKAARSAIENDKDWKSFPASADCGTGNTDLVVGVLASPTPRSTAAREVIRNTWMTFDTGNTTVTVRFLLALNASSEIPQVLAKEAGHHEDMVFLNTLDAYKNLAAKIHLFFQWVSRFCKGTKYVLKTDDDSFVRLDRFPSLLTTLPKSLLYMGIFLRKMPARKRDKVTKQLTNIPLDGNAQNLHEWPWYASGGGYLMSSDVVLSLAYPPLPIIPQTAEDRGVGIQLFGYNVTYMSAAGIFRPWGNCIESALLLHYQRDPSLMTRRFNRAIAGKNICGEGFQAHQKCIMTDQKENAVIDCNTQGKISKILYADLGKHALATGYTGPCSEGPSALLPDTSCSYNGTPSMKTIVETACLGKTNCELKNDVKQLIKSDPCPGQYKRLLIAVECTI